MGFGVGLGAVVGRAVADAAGVAVAAVTDAPALGDAKFVYVRPGIASHDTSRTASNAAKALIVLG
ncbi:MAG: hypothetical protein ACRDF9_01325 [Candidatus Limnocylindria bacterium]